MEDHGVEDCFVGALSHQILDFVGIDTFSINFSPKLTKGRYDFE
jgi:hypothetical protein